MAPQKPEPQESEEGEGPKPLHERLRSTPLRGEGGKAVLTRLLKSLASGASDTHLLVAKALYSAADIEEEPAKSLVLDQLFFCLARALEDFSMLCLMNWDDSRSPIDTYLNMDRPELRAFYARCRRNVLTEDQLFRVCGIGPGESFGRHPVFGKYVQPKHKPLLDLAAKKARQVLARYGRLYHATMDDADPELGPWQIAFAKAPIGLKLLVDKEKGGAELLMGIEEMPDPMNSGATVPHAISTRVAFSEHWVERILHEIESVCTEIRIRAELKMAFIEGPEVLLKKVEELYAEELRNPIPDDEAEEVLPAGPEADAAAAARAKKDFDEHHAFDSPTTATPGEIKQVGGIKIVHTQMMKPDDK